MIDDPGIFADFVAECRELIDTLDRGLVGLETAPSAGSLDEIFRAAHTIKGLAGFLELYAMSDLTHEMEGVLDLLRSGTLAVSPELIDLLLAAHDNLKRIFAAVSEKRPSPAADPEVVSSLRAIRLGPAAKADDAPATPAPPPAAATPEKLSPPEPIVQPPPPTTTPTPTGPTVEVEAAPVDAPGREENIRVDLGRLNTVINLLGELVTDRAALDLVEERLKDRELANVILRMGKVITQLRNLSLRLRMLPLERVFHKFPRLVRDLARKLGKEVDVEFYGGNTELDKTLIDEVHDPLLHLVRNAMDHGIESPDVRKAAGKPARGRIALKAYHQENHVVIEVSDDGAGIDREAVVRKAAARGLLGGRDPGSLQDDEIHALLFLPGFSTKEVATDVSGRGVGMDVVAEKVARMHGAVRVESRKGQGARFFLTLPMTLAILPVLLVSVRAERYGIPLNSISETLQMNAARLERGVSGDLFYLRGRAIRSLSLARTVGLSGADSERPASFPVVIVNHGDQKVGLEVDGLLGKQEVVIKPVGAYLGNAPGILGAAIQGSGQVVPILEIGTLLATI